jgi:hypothetical protein
MFGRGVDVSFLRQVVFLERGVKTVSSPFLPRYVFLTFYFCILPSLFALYIDIVFNAFWRREEANIKLF